PLAAVGLQETARQRVRRCPGDAQDAGRLLYPEKRTVVTDCAHRNLPLEPPTHPPTVGDDPDRGKTFRHRPADETPPPTICTITHPERDTRPQISDVRRPWGSGSALAASDRTSCHSLTRGARTRHGIRRGQGRRVAPTSAVDYLYSGGRRKGSPPTRSDA